MTQGINAATGKNVNYGRRKTVEQRRTMRDVQQMKRGRTAGWSEDALDYYLSGVPVDEIIRCYLVNTNTFYTSIAKAALYRLMVQHQAERLDDIPELSVEANK